MIRIAVVILNWNGLHYLQKFLPLVCGYSDLPDTKIFVVDNGSTDGSVVYVQKTFPDVNLMVYEMNLGFAPGYFKALQQIKASYYVLLNSDVEVTPNWLVPLYNTLEKDPMIGAVMPKLKAYDQKEYFEYAGASGGFIDRFGYPFCRGRILNSIEQDQGQYDESRKIFWASGACMFIRASAYHQAGGLDSEFFAHMEEIDLCWRLRRLGYTIMAIPQSTVYHVGGGTLPNNNPHKLYLNYRNNLFLLFKNLTIYQLFPLILLRMFLDWLSALAYLGSGSGSFFVAVVRAHMAFIRRIPLLAKKRKEFAGSVHSDRILEIYPRSILIDFFIRKNRYFNQLGW
jgi:GT2 family glycosyltransferase